MAALLLLTMPDTWEKASQITLSALMTDCIYGTLEADESEDLVYNAILFRWKYMELCDRIVEQLGLPIPRGQSCAVFNEVAWAREMREQGRD